ncbi:aminodeoxychorismate synthase [Diaporthe amygdali]|uniref:aminodeoxychorismate synthase n=1 Tax=Phomopsis amygdali TaxID=1214568 RepID=UPI0022FDEA18|nr:aminodeoxychorismate synthase [Diaporthe amygdali]KAJ0117062.1 aminodeoxychorismate synthase [Diaporthe amygdali]
MGSLAESPRTSSSNRPKILFIDAYDSFSNNITSLLATLLDVEVFVLPIDTAISKEDFRRELDHYEAVVCGPGPGSPQNEADVGLMNWLWELPEDDLIPVLGVCLGFQSLVLACGGKVRRLRRGLHGMVRNIEHRSAVELSRDENIFVGVRNFKATLYHSLCADVGQDTMEDWQDRRWDHPSGLCDIVPLAWVEEDREDGQGTERVLMAMKHQRKPFWGLQYHPESVCTEEAGNLVIRNWFKQALRWNCEHRLAAVSPDENIILARKAFKPSLLQRVAVVDANRPLGRDVWESMLHGSDQKLLYKSTSISISPATGIEIPDIVEVLGSTDTDHVILDSANGNQPRSKTGVDVRGRFSIIALEIDECVRIESHTGDSFISIISPGQPSHKVSLQPGENVWHLLAEFHGYKRSSLETHGGSVPQEGDVPFLGGFVGYVTYEQGLSDIGIALGKEREHRRPDVCLVWATKSIVVDHEIGILHIQDLEGDTRWIASVAAKLQDSELWRHGSCTEPNKGLTPSHALGTQIRKPEQAKYEAKVRMCQEYIAAGESYELCLTDQTHITKSIRTQKEGCNTEHSVAPSRLPGSSARKTIPQSDTSWDLYRILRKRNPAPFASYIRLGGATLVSSSPERFLQYDRSGLCSMKPMKGTIKKSSEPAEGCATTLEEAEAILHIPKEEAENLMIVDLVRHDMHGVCGAGQVWVPELLKVEEYQTVYQMITVVEGQLPQPDKWKPHSRYSGLDVLSASLPPGSMTGAPKKRSCEILQQIEGHKERSLYSGVVGYMCVSGRGDWSVTIRSMFRWDDERQRGGEDDEEKETWHIGAGGAVTILSTPEGERDEMFVKLARPLSIFGETS